MKRKRNVTRKKKKNPDHHKPLFPLILAALFSKSPNNKTLIRKCMNKVLQSLPHFRLSPIISLLPALLKFDCAEIVCKSLEIIGAASLASFETNEMIALDDETLKGLILMLRSLKREIAMAACNVVLDLSTTSVGRNRLLEFSAIENICLCFIQASKSPPPYIILLKEDEYSTLLLQCAITLINSCTIEQLHHIPKKLSENALSRFKKLWKEAYNADSDFYINNITKNNLAECIFRLSISHLPSGPVAFDSVKNSIFGSREFSIKRFLSETWEVSPMLIRDASKASLSHDSIFTPFVRFLGLKEVIPSLIPSMLKGFVSCPPIISDELDILHVIKEIKNQLGCPIIYHQDIRVLKTGAKGIESHYFQNKSGSSGTRAPHVFNSDDILKCEEVFKEGYSIALRGMEFRFQTVANIADGLASLFGQPSAGVNMYLTPSNSQGLARHSDDHCVFVCQLIGVKRWKVFSPMDLQLPRLYESCEKSINFKDESCEVEGCLEVMLKEGDVLYIPRGCPHEARTGVDNDENVNDGSGFSLHLTLAIEIEPPYEWEGFMHIALYSWRKKQKEFQDTSSDPLPWNFHLLSINLLHIAIKLLANRDPKLRKACLVGAIQTPSHAKDSFFDNQATFFEHLLNMIKTRSNFSDVVQHLEAAIQKNEDPLEHLRWMKYLAVEGEIENSHDKRYAFDLFIEHRIMAEGAFVEVMSKFCGEVEFWDVERLYKVLLEKYRKVRKEYTNGMPSLHSTLHNGHETTSF